MGSLVVSQSLRTALFFLLKTLLNNGKEGQLGMLLKEGPGLEAKLTALRTDVATRSSSHFSVPEKYLIALEEKYYHRQFTYKKTNISCYGRT